MFDYTITIIDIITSIIQSIFGTGVLLFGTPLLLLFDYEYLTILILCKSHQGLHFALTLNVQSVFFVHLCNSFSIVLLNHY